MFDLLHTFTTKITMLMEKISMSKTHKELNSVWADGGRFFIFIDFFGSKVVRKVEASLIY